LADPDNPPLSEEQLRRMALARSQARSREDRPEPKNNHRS